MMPMRVGRARPLSWTGNTGFQFFDFRALIVFTYLATPFSHVNAPTTSSAVKPA